MSAAQGHLDVRKSERSGNSLGYVGIKSYTSFALLPAAECLTV